MLERRELGGVQALIAQSPVERLDQRVFDRLPRANEIELHAVLPGPLVEEPRGELGAVIDGDRLGYRPLPRQLLQSFGHLLAGERETGLQDQTLATPLIDGGEHSKPPSVSELIVDEIHAPVLVGCRGGRHWPAMQTDALSASDPHSDL